MEWEERLTPKQKSVLKLCCCLVPHENSNLSTSFQFLKSLTHLDITFLLCWAYGKGNKHTYSLCISSCSLLSCIHWEDHHPKVITIAYLYHYFNQKVWEHLTNKHTDTLWDAICSTVLFGFLSCNTFLFMKNMKHNIFLLKATTIMHKIYINNADTYVSLVIGPFHATLSESGSMKMQWSLI